MNISTPSNVFFQRSTSIYGCIFLLVCLVLFNAALFVFQATRFFGKHLFDLSRISTVSQATAITTQTCAVVILVTLSYAMQFLSFDTIIRRRQSVAALHDNLIAWHGLGSSILALWRSRELGVRARLRVLLAFIFFGVSPGPSAFNAITYLWSQLPTNAGLPKGVNGSVLFSTLESTMTQDVVFVDPHARDLSVRCGIIPRVPADSFTVLYYGPGESSTFPTQTSLYFDMRPGFEPYPGHMQWYRSYPYLPPLAMSSGYFALGGNKPSLSAQPVFWFNDILMSLTCDPADPTDSYCSAFAYISARNDSLKLNPSIDFAPPVQYTLQTQTWSFVNNDTKNAFLEDVNATFYIWPIGCSLFVQNITAKVRGDNVLLSRTDTTPVPTGNPTPFIRPNVPRDPLELSWGQLICNILFQDALFITFQNDTQRFFTPFELQLLPGLNNTNDSLALLSERLSIVTSLSYALIVQQWRTLLPRGPLLIQRWSPAFAIVTGSRSVVMAGLVVQTLPLVIGIATCSILIFVFVTAARRAKSSDNIMRDGRVINMVSLLHNSSLPAAVASDSEDVQDLRRIRAVRTHVLYDGHTLDIDGIRKRHHNPSSANPLIILEDTGNPRNEYSSNGKPMWSSSSTSLFPESDQPSQIPQSHQNMSWFFIGLRPYLIVYVVTTILLASFYLTLIVLWSTHALNQSLFDVKRLGRVNQSVSLLSQAWAVATIAVITFTVQTIASDLAIRRRQTVAALHDTLGSWLGLVYAVVVLLRSRDHVQTRLQLILALLFFASVSILHISTPSVITVRAVNSTVPFSSSVIKMPGDLAHISASNQSLHNLLYALASTPYLWEQRNASIGLPAGHNGTTLFSTLATPKQSDVIFEDPYARRTVAQCGSIADSPLNVFNITYLPGDEPSPPSINDTLQFDLRPAFLVSQNAAMKFKPSTNVLYGLPSSATDDFFFGGGKVSMDAPPNYWMSDIFMYLPQDQSNTLPQSYYTGTTAFAYVSLRPDAFRLSPVGGDIPPAVHTQQLQIWSWIENSISVPVSPFLDQLNVTFYIWPIVCSLSVQNVTAWVRGDNRLERTNANTTLANSPIPIIRSSVPSDPMETSWSYVLDLLVAMQRDAFSISTVTGSLTAYTWLEQTLNQTWSLTSLEDRLSNFAAFYYSVLVQHWRADALNGDFTGSQWWSEAQGSVAGSQQVLFGRLDISASQLVLGCVCILVLVITSAISMHGLQIQGGPVMDGSVMDMMSLLRGSSLPGIIAGDNDEDVGRDGLRRRAERTMVMYKNSTLDVPEELDPESFPINSQDPETAGSFSPLGAITPTSSGTSARSG